MYRSCTCFVRFIPKYFIFAICAIVNGLVFFILTSNFHCWYIENNFLLHINLVSCNLAIIISARIFVCLFDSPGFVYKKSCLLQIKTVLFLPFSLTLPICILLIFFYGRIILAKISIMMLYRSGERGHPFLVLYFRGKVSNASPVSIVFFVCPLSG